MLIVETAEHMENFEEYLKCEYMLYMKVKHQLSICFPFQLRDAQSRLEELETTNNHLIKRFDKLKNARSTLLKDLSLDPV